MKNIFKNIAFAIMLLQGTPLFSGDNTWSCNDVMPNEVYCAEGKMCFLFGNTCTFSIGGSGVIGGSSITEELYDLNIPDNAFKALQLTAGNATRLPLAAYPALGNYVAYQLASVEGKYARRPFQIVIRTEVPNENFIQKIESGIKTLTDQEQKDKAVALVNNLKSLKDKSQGVNAIYRRVPYKGETKFKLYAVRVPRPNGYIQVRPDGHLQLHEVDPAKPNEEKVSVLDTGDLV